MLTDYDQILASVVTVTKLVTAIADRTKDSALKKEVSELNLQIATIKDSLAALINENRELRSKVAVSETKFVKKGNLYFTEDGQGPFCVRCAEVDYKKVPLNRTQHYARSLPQYICDECDAKYFR